MRGAGSTFNLQFDGVQLRFLARLLHGFAQFLAQLLFIGFQRAQLFVVPASCLFLQISKYKLNILNCVIVGVMK